ncbi:MAG: tetratricopeptide repeat protein [Blastocatellia bacterium]|nr:tetratricopeptide repeat protein [Blastocatellia bacterium]
MKSLYSFLRACIFSLIILSVLACEGFAQGTRDSLREAITGPRELIFQGDYDGAIERFTEIAQKYPRSPAGDFYRAVALLWKSYVDARKLEKGDREFDGEIERLLESAIKKAEVILARDDESKEDRSDALYYSGSAYSIRSRVSLFQNHALPATKYARAAQNTFEELIALDPDYADAYFASGSIYYQVGLLTDSPIGKIATTMLGAKALPVGDREKGLNYLKTAAERGPRTSVDAKFALLEIYTFNENLFDEAARLASELQTRYPENQTFWRYLLRAYAGLKDRHALDRTAKEILARVKEGKPGFGSFMKFEAQKFMTEARKW